MGIHSKYKLYQTYKSEDGVNWTPTDKYKAILLEECSVDCGCGSPEPTPPTPPEPTPTTCTTYFAFTDNTSTSVTLSEIPDNWNYDNKAFEGKNVKEVRIGNCVTSIGKMAFSQNRQLRVVTIGDGVTTIGDKAFSGFTQLSSVTIGSGVQEIGDYVFQPDGLDSAVPKLTYKGTQTQFGNIRKGSYWQGNIRQVTCTDGIWFVR